MLGLTLLLYTWLPTGLVMAEKYFTEEEFLVSMKVCKQQRESKRSEQQRESKRSEQQRESKRSEQQRESKKKVSSKEN
jgi:hypothetical protein